MSRTSLNGRLAQPPCGWRNEPSRVPWRAARWAADPGRTCRAVPPRSVAPPPDDQDWGGVDRCRHGPPWRQGRRTQVHGGQLRVRAPALGSLGRGRTIPGGWRTAAAVGGGPRRRGELHAGGSAVVGPNVDRHAQPTSEAPFRLPMVTPEATSCGQSRGGGSGGQHHDAHGRRRGSGVGLEVLS
jgi:hypothetical protein